jgi:hypothetical protein
MGIFLLQKLNSGAGYATEAEKKAMRVRMAGMRTETPGKGCLKVTNRKGILVRDG